MAFPAPQHGDDRKGARQAERFNPERASQLDDPSRFEYLAPSAVANLLDVPLGGALADFGTGTGTYALELAQLRPDVTVYALDELPEMLERLRSKLSAAALLNLKPMLAPEAAELIGRMDRVLALNVLHELGDEALQQLAGLLKPDSFALFIDWNAAVERPVGPPTDHVYTPSEAKSRLEGLGWTILLERTFPYHYAFRARAVK